ncbi:hypothetical protein REPUB_Repub17cG0031900 [Reevesia pubescens]
MGKTEVKGTVTSLASMFPAEEAQKAAKRVEETLSEKQNEMNQLREFIAYNTSLINLVPFGKAAFFPGRLLHTNEYLDLKVEASFFDSTASEAADGLVEIREEYEEENSTEMYLNQAVLLEQESPSFAEPDYTIGASEDDKYARIILRLEELEKEELATESYAENDEDRNVNTADIDVDEDEQTKVVFHGKKDEGYRSLDHDQRYSESRKPLQQSKGKDSMNEEMYDKYHHQDLTNKLACTGLTLEPVTTGEMSHNRITPQDTKMLNPSINASVPFEKKVRFEVEHSSQNEITREGVVNNLSNSKFVLWKFVKISKSEFDSSKAFMGSTVEHTQILEKILPGQTKTSSQFSGSQPSKPMSRFKMQRK